MFEISPDTDDAAISPGTSGTPIVSTDAASPPSNRRDGASSTPSPDSPDSTPDASQGSPEVEAGSGPDVQGSALADTGTPQPIDDAGEGGTPDATISVSFCASLTHKPRFCEDFDSEHSLPGMWAQINQTGGHLGLDTTAVVSAPASLEAQFDALQPSHSLNTALRTTFPMPSAPVTIAWDFALQVAQTDSTPNAAIVVDALDSFDAAGNRYSVQFTVYAAQDDTLHVRFEEESGFVDGTSAYVAHVLPDPLQPGTWTDIHALIDYASPRNATARVSMGGVEEVSTPLSVTVAGTTLQLTIGSSFETLPSLGWTMRYDNVTFDF